MTPEERRVQGELRQAGLGYEPSKVASLRRWRDSRSISVLHNALRSAQLSKILFYSVVILAAGGLLDTVAAVQAGFLPIWGTEICKKQQAMWKTLLNTPIHSDTFGPLPDKHRPIYLKSGQPCIDFTRQGAANRFRHGRDGDTGWMFTRQVDIIKAKNPLAFCLEMTDNSINIHNGSEVDEVIESLSRNYVVHYDLI